jgi:hypothetical protein
MDTLQELLTPPHNNNVPKKMELPPMSHSQNKRSKGGQKDTESPISNTILNKRCTSAQSSDNLSGAQRKGLCKTIGGF